MGCAPGAVDTFTRLVLVNALYMYAAWNTAFNPQVTYDGSGRSGPIRSGKSGLSRKEQKPWNAEARCCLRVRW